MIDRSDPTMWDFIADLLAGRIHQEFRSLTRRLDRLRRDIDMSTATEQQILEAASRINQSVTLISTNVESLKQKIVTLQEQAASSEAHEPEDLTQEFQELNAALNNLASAGSSITEGSGETPPIAEVPHDPTVAPGETPIAGASGPTNPPSVPDDSEDTDTVNPSPVEEGSPTEMPIDQNDHFPVDPEVGPTEGGTPETGTTVPTEDPAPPAPIDGEGSWR